MSHWFDDAAVEIEAGFTRRRALRNAAAGMLLATPLGALAASPPKAEARSACTDCLADAAQRHKYRYKRCFRTLRTGILSPIGAYTSLVACQMGTTARFAVDVSDCYSGPCQTPPPQNGQACNPAYGSLSVSSVRAAVVTRGGGTCQVIPSSEGTPPAPGSPAVDECANCNLVGGKCCFGGPDPNHLCACANPDLPCCERYGCC